MNKTRRVEIPRLVKHPRYGKYIKRRTICHVHDENERIAHGRHGRDHGNPAAVEDEELAAGARRHEGARASAAGRDSAGSEARQSNK